MKCTAARAADPHVVIVGCGAAGWQTAEALRRLGTPSRITVVGREEHPAYQRPPLSKGLLTQADEPTTPPPLARAADAAEQLDIAVRLNLSATALDIEARTVALSDGSTLDWDRLVIATGVGAALPTAWAGVEQLATLRDFTDLLDVRRRVSTARRTVVIGGGVLGCEVSAALRQRGLTVDLIEPLSQPMLRMVGPCVGQFMADLHRAAGVHLHLGRQVALIKQSADGAVITLDDGHAIEADLVMVAVGAQPHTDWLIDSGLRLDASGRVLVDSTGQASAQDVFAVGDVLTRTSPTGEAESQEHWTHAGESARLVAANLFTPPGARAPFAELPYAWSDQWASKIQVLGKANEDLHLCRGSLDEGAFLGFFADRGRVVGAVACNQVPHLMRVRKPVEERWPLVDAIDAATATPGPKRPPTGTQAP